MKEVLLFLTDNWEFIAPIILWIGVRVIPTKKNYDFLEKGVTFISDKIIPNRKTRETVEENLAKQNTHKKNNNIIKSLTVLFLISSFAVNAQLNGNFKSIRLVNVIDSTTVLPINATIYYNEQTGKLRAFENGEWKDVISDGGGGGLTTASNGLTAVGDDVQLGGTLTGFTTITSAANQALTFNSVATSDGAGTFSIGDPDSEDYTFVVTGTNTSTLDESELRISAGSAGGGSLASLGAGNNTMTIRNNSFNMNLLTGAANFTGNANALNFVGFDTFNSQATNVVIGATGSAALLMNASGLTLSDIRATPTGLQYAGNYDATLTDNSLIPRRVAWRTEGTSVLSSVGSTIDGFTNGAVIELNTDQDFITKFGQIIINGNNAPVDIDGDVTINNLTYPTTDGTNGQVLTTNGAGALTFASAGITNTAANNEIPKSDGTNIVPSGVFSIADGDLNLGDVTLAGDRTIKAANSTNTADLILESDEQINYNVGAGTASFTSSGATFNSSASTYQILSTDDLTIRGDVTTIATNNASGASNSQNLILTSGDASGTGNTGDVVLEAFVPSGSGASGEVVINSTLELGNTLLAGDRSINVVSSDAASDLNVSVQGNGAFNFSGSTNYAQLNSSIFELQGSQTIQGSAVNIAFSGATDFSSTIPTFKSRDASGSGSTGLVTLTSGDGITSGNVSSGNVIIDTGTPIGTGTKGDVIIDGLITKVVDIGVWDMQTDDTNTINLTTLIPDLTDFLDVVLIKGVIYNDGNTRSDMLVAVGTADTSNGGGVQNINGNPSVSCTLVREINGLFDDADYNDGVQNRGKLFVTYLN